jgi:hypothetical protein
MSPYIHESVPHRRKRVRFSPNSSSEPSVSDLASTTAASSTTNASDYYSSSSSELSESSEEPSDDSSSEDEGEDTEMEEQAEEGQDGVVNLRANRGKKPVMKLRDDEDLGPDIRGFLKDFLPKLKESNEELERQREAGTLRGLDEGAEEEEGGPYIEMVCTLGGDG